VGEITLASARKSIWIVHFLTKVVSTRSGLVTQNVNVFIEIKIIYSLPDASPPPVNIFKS